MKARWLLLAGAVVVAHICIFGGEFVYDDITQVKENPRIRSFANIPAIFTTKYWPPEIKAGLYRPLTLTTFIVDYHLWGLRPGGFRLVNLVLHFVTVLLVLRLLETIRFPPPAAFLGALLFAVHPVHAETVTAAVGRNDILASMGVLIAVLLFIRYRRGGGAACLAGIGACFLLGILSKELTVCLPLLFLGGDLVGERGGPRPIPRLVAPYVPVALILAIYLPVRTAIIGALGPVEANTVFYGDPLTARWGTMLGVLFDYVKMFLLPVNLAADFPYPPGTVPGFDIRALLGAATLILLAGAAFRFPGRFGFSIAIFLFALAPVSNIVIPTGIVKAARLLYLPSVGLSALGGWLLWRAASVGHGPRIAVAIVIVLLAGLNLKTATYWLENETLWRRSLEISPSSAKGLYNLGAILATRGEEAEAEQLWLKARSLDERDSGAQVALGRLYRKQGRMAEAEQAFKDVLLLSPPRGRAIAAMLGLAEVFAETGRLGDAKQQIGEVLKAYPDAPEGHFARGVFLCQQGRWRDAEEDLRAAVSLEPASGAARRQLGLCLYQTGRFREALSEYEGALPLLREGEKADVVAKMGDAMLAQGEKPGAAALYREATRLNPRSGPAWNNLGQTLFMLQEWEEAREAFLRARPLLGDHRIILLRLGQTSANLGEKQKARGYLEELLEDPRAPEPLKGKARALLEKMG